MLVRSLALRLSFLLSALSFAACTPARDAAAPKSEANGASFGFPEAFSIEMKDPLADAGYLDAIDRAVKDPDATESLPTVVASLHALVEARDGDAARLTMPIAFRSREGMQRAVLRLRQSWDALDGSSAKNAPFLRAFIARSLHSLALYSGEARGANVWRDRRGCVSQATVVGPIASAPLRALDEASPVAASGAFARQYQGITTLSSVVRPIVVDADACMLDSHVTGAYGGATDLVVDIENPHDQTLSFIVQSSAAASLRVAGKTVLTRPFDRGGQQSIVLGQVHAGEGDLRAILRLADRGDAGPVEIDVLGEDGNSLRTRAPRGGEEARATVSEAHAVSWPLPAGGEAATTHAAALLAIGDPRAAEHGIETARAGGNTALSPALSLLYVRAMEAAGDAPDARRVERTRSAIDDVTKQRPDSWEAKLVQAEITQRRKGVGDGVFAALQDFGVTTPTPDLSHLNVVELAVVMEMAQQAGLGDVAERVFGELAKRTPDSALVARADASVHRRTGKDQVTAACAGGLDRSSSGCAGALLGVGDRKGARAEITRIRELRSAPAALADLELQLAIKDGDKKRALAIYDAIPPGQRSLQQILPLLDSPEDRPLALDRIRRDIGTARDGLMMLTRIGDIFGEPNADAKTYEALGQSIVDADRKTPIMPGAATAVLKHVEHFGLDESGLLHLFSYDLRRMSGTTDVDQSFGPSQAWIEGRGSYYQLRRRIFKKRDGRVLEPDTADRAGAGGGGDLAQLEAGDYLETISTGYYLPTDGGELTIDTPDLLPERTSVADAELVLRLPERFAPAMWAHKQLGAPVTETKQGYKISTYRVENRTARRLEDGVPALEQGVRISLSTATWPRIGRSIGETIRSLENPDPFMKRFADDALKGDGTAPAPTTDEAKVARVVEAVGRALKIAGGGQLSDSASAYGGGSQGMTARGMVEDRQGSRSWVIFQSLENLGFKVDLAIAEATPFAGSPDFPPHNGRFSYPLVVVHLPSGDQWIDADVEGPPLPPGKVSPELRGRSAMLSDGRIVPVVSQNDEAGDDVDIQLSLDAKGTAKGKITLKLHGREAQGLSEAFNTVVGSDRREMLRNVVMAWMPWADVDDVRLTSTEGAWEVVIGADVSVHGFGSPLGRDGHTLVLAGLEPTHAGRSASTLAQTYATRGARESALSIDSPIQYHLKRHIDLPAGMTVVKPPVGVDVKSGNLGASRKTQISGSSISEDFTLSVPTGTVNPDQYGAFVTDVESVDSAFLSGIRVKVGP